MSQIKWAKDWLQIMRDLLFVLRELWLLLGIHLIALYSFLLLPQGTDMILSILEPKTFISNTISIALLLIAIFWWSISSEFCTRFLIYMTDNSGHSLSPDRVVLRKSIQKLIAQLFLYFPLLLISLAFIKTYFQNLSDISNYWWMLLLILLMICMLISLLHYLYQPDQRNKTPNIFHWMHLSKEEKYWTSKLYGIFNDYRVDLQEEEMTLPKDDLPRNVLLPNGSYVPTAFQLKEGPIKLTENKQVRIWMFRIPLTYFRNLITQFLLLLLFSVLLITYFSFASTQLYQGVGAVTLLCFAFGSWLIIYTLFHFLDKAQPIPKIKVPFRLLIFLWVCVCSYINNDHPVRWIEQEKFFSGKKVSEHFKSWITQLLKKENYQNEDQIPVFFLASEGGALRTGAYTALLLAKIQDSFPNFKNHIYCYSGISGGSLGLQYFQSLPEVLSLNKENRKSTAAFFETDFLSPVIGKLVYGEVLNTFLPFQLVSFDRAISLEKVWELSWASANKNQPNSFEASFDNLISDNSPAIFINSVESETGLPTVWTNTILDSSISLATVRDLRNKFHLSIPYSTAINLGTRFPVISPAAMFQLNQNKDHVLRFHYIDGGYFENKGQENLLEIIEAIHLEQYPAVKPYIIQFNYSQDDLSSRNIRFANELMEVINGIENTRYARASLTVESLKKFMRNHFDTSQIINLNLEISTRKLPMNWLLSQTAFNRIENYTNSQMNLKKDSNQIINIFNAITKIKK